MRNTLCRFTWTAPFTSRLPFLALVIFFLSADSIAQTATVAGGVLVTPSTPGFNPTGSASNNAYGVAENLGKTVSTGRVGYPSVPVANQSAMSGTAARNAMRGVWRAAGWAGFAVAAVYAGGEFLNYLQCTTNGICKPGEGARTDPAGNNPAGKYCADTSTYGQGYCGAFPVDACATLYGADSYRTDSGDFGYCYYAGFGGIRRYISKIQNACPAGYGWSGGACVNMAGTAPVPATDSDLERAADAYRAAQPQRFVDDLRGAGKWAPDQNTMSAPQPDVAGAPSIRELPEDKPGTPNGKKIEEITPHTAAKASPDAQSVNVYNYNVTTVTHTDGSTETVSGAQNPDLNIPDDYAREETLDAVRKALVEREAAPGDDGCTAQPTCSGDAIACAMLVEQYKGRCAFKNEQIPEELPTPPQETDLNTIVGNLNSSRWAGSAVCPPDLHATVAGYQITVPMDQPCAQATFVRPAVIAAALLMAGMIIMRVE